MMSPSQRNAFMNQLVNENGLDGAIKIMQKNVELSSRFENLPNFDKEVQQSWKDIVVELQQRANRKMKATTTEMISIKITNDQLEDIVMKAVNEKFPQYKHLDLEDFYVNYDASKPDAVAVDVVYLKESDVTESVSVGCSGKCGGCK